MEITPFLVAAVAILGGGIPLILMFNSRHRDLLVTGAVGVTGGLYAAQVLQVHVFTITVVIWAVTTKTTARSGFPWRAVLLVVAAALLAVTAVTGDLVNSPTLGLQLLGLALSGAIIAGRASAIDIRRILHGLLINCAFGSMWAILQVAHLLPNNWTNDALSIPRPTGIYTEPDWLGMFAGIGLILAWRLALPSALRVLLISDLGLAFIFSFARAAWIAGTCTLLLACVLSMIAGENRRRNEMPTTRDLGGDFSPSLNLQKKPGTGRLAAVALLVGGASAIIFIVPSLSDDLVSRLSRTLVANVDDVSAQTRVLQNNALNSLLQSAPWYGHGLSASGRASYTGTIITGETTNNVGTNWIIAMLVDGKLLALPLIILMLALCVIAAKTMQGQALVLTLLSSFFSNATYQPIVWLLLGLCLAHHRVLGQGPSTRKVIPPGQSSRVNPIPAIWPG